MSSFGFGDLGKLSGLLKNAGKIQDMMKEVASTKTGLEEFKLNEYATIVDDLGQVRNERSIMLEKLQLATVRYREIQAENELLKEKFADALKLKEELLE